MTKTRCLLSYYIWGTTKKGLPKKVRLRYHKCSRFCEMTRDEAAAHMRTQRFRIPAMYGEKESYLTGTIHGDDARSARRMKEWEAKR